MKTPSKVTPDVRRRVFELKAGGKSLRQTEAILEAEGVLLTYRSVGEILKGEQPGAEGARGGAGKGTGEQRGAERPPDAPRTAAGTPAVTWEDLPELPLDADVATRALWMKVREARARIKQLPPSADASSEYAAVSRIELAALEKLKAALPKPKPDPTLDPHNIAAREMVHQHVVATIESVKARARRLGYRFPGDEP